MLKIATAQININPTGDYFPCFLCGHAIRTELAKGIMDDLHIRVIVLKSASKTIVWASFELVGLSKDFYDETSTYIAQKYKIPKNDVFLSFTHTHCAPDCSDDFCQDISKERKYMQFVKEALYQVVFETFNHESEEVHAMFQVTAIDGYYGNRNGLDRPSDKDVTIILFKNAFDKNVAAICNFTCHPTVLGPQNLYVSSDLAGYLSCAIADIYHCSCFIMQGAAGDMSNRLYRQGNDELELKRMGSGIMKQISANTTFTDLNIDQIEIRAFRYDETFPLNLEDKKRQLHDCQQKIVNAKTYDEKKVYSSALKHTQNEIDHFKSTYTLSLQCYYLKIGDLSIFTMPAELFSKFGIEIKKAMNNKCNIFWGYTNYSVGYLYNQEAAGESFESAVSNIPSGISEKIVSLIVEFVK